MGVLHKENKKSVKKGQKKVIDKSAKSAAWQKVKLTGNLVSDDGGFGLEGLIGLEVLEDAGAVSVTKQKLAKVKKNAPKFEHSDDSDSDHAKNSKNRKKKLKKLKKKAKQTTEDDSAPGKFVRPLYADSNNKTKPSEQKKSKKLNEAEADEESKPVGVTMDELIGWNGFGIAEPILKAIAEKGFKEPTEIQALTLPAAIMGRRDILGAAETGSGKTLAFGIPIINGILHMKKNPERANFRKVSLKAIQAELEAKQSSFEKQQSKKKKKISNTRERDNLTPPPEEINNFPQIVEEERDDGNERDSKPLYALILTPTRELAVQVRDHLIAIAKHANVRVAAVFGGLAAVKQERLLSKCPEIVVATPGRLWELINEGNKHLNKLQHINFFVVDETDRMIEKGHFEELKLILARLNADPVLKAQRQNFVFSATLTMIHELPVHLKQKNMNRKRKLEPLSVEQKLDSLIQYFDISQPKIIDVTQSSSSTGGIAKNLTECRISTTHDQKDLYLYYFLLQHPGRTIVFCNSIDCVRRLAKLFAILKCEPLALHAKMAQRARLKNLERFTRNPNGMLVATDVAARGLDIPNVEHVIHYQVPRTSENYVHRSGRTARGNKEGIAVLIMEPNESSVYLKLCRTLKRSEDLPLFPVSERYLNAVRERISLARKIDIEELRMRRKNADIGWLKKSAMEMDIIVDNNRDFSDLENDSDDELDVAMQSNANRRLKQLKDNFKHLMAKPVFPAGISYKYPTSTIIDSNGSTNTDLRTHSDKESNAVNVMKTAIEDYKLAKKNKKANI